MWVWGASVGWGGEGLGGQCCLCKLDRACWRCMWGVGLAVPGGKQYLAVGIGCRV